MVKNLFSTKDLHQIEAAIARAEAHTRGEIVPMVVERSMFIAHIRWLVFFFFAFVWMSAQHFVLRYQTLDLWMELLQSVIVLPLLFVLATRLERKELIQRSFSSESDRLAQAQQRAEIEFFEAGLHKTKGGTGVLIFFSLMEHCIVILADETIAKQLPPKIWAEITDQALKEVKTRGLSAALISAISSVGSTLAEYFPRAPDDKNELRNHLIIKP